MSARPCEKRKSEDTCEGCCLFLLLFFAQPRGVCSCAWLNLNRGDVQVGGAVLGWGSEAEIVLQVQPTRVFLVVVVLVAGAGALHSSPWSALTLRQHIPVFDYIETYAIRFSFLTFDTLKIFFSTVSCSIILPSFCFFYLLFFSCGCLPSHAQTHTNTHTSCFKHPQLHLTLKAYHHLFPTSVTSHYSPAPEQLFSLKFAPFHY